jgi:hypothetical protein
MEPSSPGETKDGLLCSGFLVLSFVAYRSVELRSERSLGGFIFDCSIIMMTERERMR